MTFAVILAGLAMFVSGATFLLVLVLLGRREFQYATKADLDEHLKRMAILGRNQSRLYRYMEALDEHLGANGHRVLGTCVPDEDSEDVKR